MVKPPSQLFVVRILEIDNLIFIPVEKRILEDLRRFVRHSRVFELGPWVYLSANKAAEKRSGSGAVEAMVVVEDS
jgi:hypothetical protein